MRFKWVLISGLFAVGLLLLPFSYVTYSNSEYYPELDIGVGVNVAAQAVAAVDVAERTIWQSILRQVDGVLSFTAQTIDAIGGAPDELFGVISNDPPEDASDLAGSNIGINAENQLPSFPPPEPYDGTLIFNVPLLTNDDLSVAGQTELNDLFVAGEFSITDLDVPGSGTFGSLAAGGGQLGSLSVSGNTQLNTLSVSGPVNFANLTAGSLTVSNTFTSFGSLAALGGVTTGGADVDLEGGEIFAANIINEIIAGDNIDIEGPPNAPIISADVPSLGSRVRSLNGSTGSVTLAGGTDITVAGLTIDNTSTLSTVAARGGCVDCILDADVVGALTIASGTIDATVIGSTTPALATFTTVTVTDSATSSYAGSINVTGGGCVAVNGVCISGAVSAIDDLSDVTITGAASGEILTFNGGQWVNATTGSLGLGGTYLSLTDTPGAYVAGAIAFVDGGGSAMTQSANLIYDGSSLAVGTSTPVTTLTVNGDVSVLGRQEVRFYETDDSNYVGFQASTTLAGDVTWTLPIADGNANEILTTDGAGNLRFDSIAGLGGVTALDDLSDVTLTATTSGDILRFTGAQWVNASTAALGLGDGTYLGLTDTPGTYINGAIVYATTSSLTQSTGLVYDGSRLTVGSTTPITTLTVNGDASVVSQQAVRFYETDNTDYVAFRASSTLATTTVWTLPTADGGANQILTTDGAGNLSFQNLSSFGVVTALNDLSDVTLTSTTTGDILRFTGTQWVNASTAALGLGDGTYLGLTDTPAAYTANAVVFANAAANALSQSANFVFDGTSLAVGTSTPITTLTVDGNASIIEGQHLRFYESDNSNYVALQASSSMSSDVTLTLPADDGIADQVLVTDGTGVLRFSDVSAIGGGVSRWIDLQDTPSAFIENRIPVMSSTSVTFSSALAYNGTGLSIGTATATARLTVHGSVFIGANGTTEGLTYDNSGNRVGVGTSDPDARFTVEGGTILQRGAESGDTYTPTAISSINLADTANDVFVVGTMAYVVTASVGDDFHIIDISQRSNPVEIGSLNLPTNANDIYVSGDYAYVVTDVSGTDLHVIDISDPTTPTEAGSVGLPTSARGLTVQGRYAYVTTADTGDDFHVIDISDPTTPAEVGSADLPINANAVDVSGDYAYVVTDSTSGGFYVFDVSDPTMPTQVATATLPATANDIEVRGNYAYVGTGSSGDDFHIFDISSSTSPSLSASLGLTSGVNGLSISGAYAYVTTQGTGDDIHVIDITDPAAPVEVGSEEVVNGTALSIAVAGRYGYMTTSVTGDDFSVFDLTGVDAQTVLAHSLESGSLNVLGDLVAGGSLSLAGGIRAGFEGLQTDGSLLVRGSDESIVMGNLAVGGTTSAPYALTVNGDAFISGLLYDASSTAGTYGQLLMANGVGQVWTATSSLGLSGAFTTSADLAGILSDETGAAGNVVFSTSPTFTGTVAVNALTASSTLTLNGTGANIALGSNFLSGDGGDEGIFIDSTGLVGIATSAPATELTVDGTVRVSDLYGGAVNITTDAQGNIIRDPSDVNLKTNITEIEDALDIVLALRGVRYQWIDTERFGVQTEVGFIAQEVDLVLPEVVRKGGDYWSLNTRNILAVVIEAMQEMWDTISGNQEKIDSLEARIDQLESLLDIEPPVVAEPDTEDDTEDTDDTEDSVPESPEDTDPEDTASSTETTPETAATSSTTSDSSEPDTEAGPEPDTNIGEDTGVPEDTESETEESPELEPDSDDGSTDPTTETEDDSGTETTSEAEENGES